MKPVPRPLMLAGAVVLVLGIVPFAVILRARNVHTAAPHVHPVLDMDAQPKFKAQAANTMFADGRAMRPPVPGTVPFGAPDVDPAYRAGRYADGFVVSAPVRVTPQLLRRGQERYGIFCSPCHGLAGTGDGMVAKRADRLMEGTWTPPTSLLDPTVKGRPDGHLFNTITNGIRNMPAYGSQIDVADRWAIVAYVRALQRSQDARLEDVPPEVRGTLR